MSDRQHNLRNAGRQRLAHGANAAGVDQTGRVGQQRTHRQKRALYHGGRQVREERSITGQKNAAGTDPVQRCQGETIKLLVKVLSGALSEDNRGRSGNQKGSCGLIEPRGATVEQRETGHVQRLWPVFLCGGEPFGEQAYHPLGRMHPLTEDVLHHAW